MIRLVCFDLDDTLIQGVHSVMLLCMLNGKMEQLLEIEKAENSGRLNWIAADYQKAALLQGLPIAAIQKGFDDIMKPLRNIGQTIEALRQSDIQSIIITAGPAK